MLKSRCDVVALTRIFDICAMHITFLVIKLDTRWQSFQNYDYRTSYNALEVNILILDGQTAPLITPNAHHITPIYTLFCKFIKSHKWC